MNRTNGTAIETVMEAHPLHDGYVPVAREGFDRERDISELQIDVETAA